MDSKYLKQETKPVQLSFEGEIVEATLTIGLDKYGQMKTYENEVSFKDGTVGKLKFIPKFSMSEQCVYIQSERKCYTVESKEVFDWIEKKNKKWSLDTFEGYKETHNL